MATRDKKRRPSQINTQSVGSDRSGSASSASPSPSPSSSCYQEDDVEDDFTHEVQQIGKPRGRKARDLSQFSQTSGQKLFVCTHPGCRKVFKRNEHLNRHLRMHTGEKPFQCMVKGCLRRFTRGDNLLGHIVRTHDMDIAAARRLVARTRSSAAQQASATPSVQGSPGLTSISLSPLLESKTPPLTSSCHSPNSSMANCTSFPNSPALVSATTPSIARRPSPLVTAITPVVSTINAATSQSSHFTGNFCPTPVTGGPPTASFNEMALANKDTPMLSKEDHSTFEKNEENEEDNFLNFSLPKELSHLVACLNEELDTPEHEAPSRAESLVLFPTINMQFTNSSTSSTVTQKPEIFTPITAAPPSRTQHPEASTSNHNPFGTFDEFFDFEKLESP